MMAALWQLPAFARFRGGRAADPSEFLGLLLEELQQRAVGAVPPVPDLSRRWALSWLLREQCTAQGCGGVNEDVQDGWHIRLKLPDDAIHYRPGADPPPATPLHQLFASFFDEQAECNHCAARAPDGHDRARSLFVRPRSVVLMHWIFK
eukprot:gene1894-3864_t